MGKAQPFQSATGLLTLKYASLIISAKIAVCEDIITETSLD